MSRRRFEDEDSEVSLYDVASDTLDSELSTLDSRASEA